MLGQHLLSRRFRCAATEAEYHEWHFSIWGRRTANFALCVAALVLLNLCILLMGGSTRRRALDRDDSAYALGSLVAGLPSNPKPRASAFATRHAYPRLTVCIHREGPNVPLPAPRTAHPAPPNAKPMPTATPSLRPQPAPPPQRPQAAPPPTLGPLAGTPSPCF